MCTTKKGTTKPIFIHSLFRTGSTYLWNKFREKEIYYCYYEPFHENLLDLNEKTLKEDITEKTKIMSHPRLKKHYFFEYPKKDGKGVPFFEKAFTLDTYCMGKNENNEKVKNYIQFLIDFAKGQPVFGFCRSPLRSAWLKNNFDSINIYLLRNHRNQWESYLSFKEPYFNIIDLMIVGKNSNHQRFIPLSKVIFVPFYQNESFNKEYQFYKNIMGQYTIEDRYFIFFYIWIVSLIENITISDIIADIDAINTNHNLRNNFLNLLRKFDIHLDIDDCNIKSYNTFSMPEATMALIELGVIRLLLDSKVFDFLKIEKVFNYMKWSCTELNNKFTYRPFFGTSDYKGLINTLVSTIMKDDSQICSLESKLAESHVQLRNKDIQIASIRDLLKNTIQFLEIIIWKLQEEVISSQLALEVGKFCISLKLFNNAKYFFEKVLVLDPNNSDALNNLGVLSYKRGDYYSAKDFFIKIINQNPLNLEAKQNLETLEKTINKWV